MWTPASQAIHHREVHPALKHDKANTHGEAGRVHAPRSHHNQTTEPHLSDRNEYREPKSFQVKRYSQQCNHAVEHESPFDPENSDEFFLQGVAMDNEPNGGYPSIIDDGFTPPKERRSASEAIHAPNNPSKLRQSSIASPSMPDSGDNSSKMYDDDDANLVLHLEEDDDALMDPASHDDAYDEMGSQQVQGKETWKDSQFERLRPAATSLAEATIDTRSQIRNQDTVSVMPLAASRTTYRHRLIVTFLFITSCLSHPTKLSITSLLWLARSMLRICGKCNAEPQCRGERRATGASLTVWDPVKRLSQS